MEIKVVACPHLQSLRFDSAKQRDREHPTSLPGTVAVLHPLLSGCGRNVGLCPRLRVSPTAVTPGSCSMDSPPISACQTMQQIASDASKFYSDSQGQMNGCSAGAQSISDLVSLFKSVGYSLLPPRLLPTVRRYHPDSKLLWGPSLDFDYCAPGFPLSRAPLQK